MTERRRLDFCLNKKICVKLKKKIYIYINWEKQKQKAFFPNGVQYLVFNVPNGVQYEAF